MEEADQRADWKTTAGTAALVAVVGLLAVVAFVSAYTMTTRGGRSETDQLRRDAYKACVGFVTDRLVAPRTAEFAGFEESRVSGFGLTFTVDSWVDSQNSFGALIRSDYRCVAERRGSVWVNSDLEIDGR